MLTSFPKSTIESMNLVRLPSILIIFFAFTSSVYAQKTYQFSENFVWNEIDVRLNNLSEVETKIYESSKTNFSYKHPVVPVYSKKIKINGFASLSANIETVHFSDANVLDDKSRGALSNEIKIHLEVAKERNEYYALVSFIPFIKEGNTIKKVEKISISVLSDPKKINLRTGGNTFTSVLSDGDIYKMSLSQTGIIKLDYDFLKNQLGVDNLDNINPSNIQIFGNGGGPLPQSSEISRIDDLQEIPIDIIGGNDNNFGSSDYILLYGEGADVWRTNEDQYLFQKNIYDQNNYYYLKVGSESGLRIQNQETTGAANYSSDQSDHLMRHEIDEINLLGAYGSTQGSGQLWFSNNFNVDREQNFSSSFVIPDHVSTEPVDLTMSYAGRSGQSHQVELIVNNEVFQRSIPSVSTGNIEAHYAALVSINDEIVLPNGTPNVEVRHPLSSDLNEGWLDYIQMIARRTAVLSKNQEYFQDARSFGESISEMTISGLSGGEKLWDITDPIAPKNIDIAGSSNSATFKYESTNEVKRFIAFKNSGYLSATAVGKIENQNIHGLDNIDFVIIYHPNFESDAIRLAEHRREHDDMDVTAVNVEKIYNEFSSGKVDPTAIRDFARMLYNRNTKFKSLLLFGDGSYDYKTLMPGLDNQSFIPVYETRESIDPIGSFPTDDYFGLLDVFEGDDLKGMLDIGVGRITVRTQEEAQNVVDKIIHYDTNPNTLGEWRVNLGFTADDEDNNIHINQAEDIATGVQAAHELFNQKKVYFDAYLQEATPGGQRFPDANAALNNNIFKGMLALNYLGHGGSKGWAQERVLQINDIISWDNYDAMTLLVTATCSFTGYDDPGLTSAGELAFLNKNGGAIGLYSTVRAVYSFENKRLTESVYDNIFTRDNGKYLNLGETLRRAKNQNWLDTARINARKFTLIGDPSMTLAIPEFNIVTTEINDADFNPSNPDTIRALQKVSIKGFVSNPDGSKKTDFNGIVFPTIFDKESNLETIANDEKSFKRQFGAYKNILFKGAATVSNGDFSFEFVVPKDINYEFGKGKISYYATDGVSEDAAGFTTDIIIGGTDPNAVADDNGPEIQLFMNDENFVFGGTTDANPILLVNLKDDFGINISGTSIGHDLTGELDDDSQQSFIMNEFYEANVDDFTSGTARYPLKDLSPGLHKIKVKAWDVSNNVSEAIIEFRVLDDSNNGLNRVLNYPNPFTTNTCFQFEHDLAGSQLDILVHIYTLSGKLVKTIKNSQLSQGYRIDNLKWDGRDDFGSKLGKGIYLYKIKVYSPELNQRRESNFEKLAILK